MKKIFCLAIVLAVFVNVNTFSASKKSNSTKNSSSVQNQPEAVKVALNVVNSLMKRNGFNGPSLISSETQDWVYGNSRFTDDFKTEYENIKKIKYLLLYIFYYILFFLKKLSI